MDKPISLSVKDYIIRKMSVKMMLSESVIESVVNHQFKSMMEAFVATPANYSIEMGGIGKFLFNKKKAKKKYESFLKIKESLEKGINSEETSDVKKRNYKLKLESIIEDINALKPKIEENELFTDLRGMEEQSISSGEDEGNNKEGVSGEVGYLL